MVIYPYLAGGQKAPLSPLQELEQGGCSPPKFLIVTLSETRGEVSTSQMKSNVDQINWSQPNHKLHKHKN